jgi:drug/metabolite transporter (DMT)-like permease
VLIAFSVLFTVNIAISNISLAMVSIPFHQIMRSTCPVFAVLVYRLRYGRKYSTRTYLSLVPVVLGVGLATYGDYYFTVAGFCLTLAGVVLAVVKVSPE